VSCVCFPLVCLPFEQGGDRTPRFRAISCVGGMLSTCHTCHMRRPSDLASQPIRVTQGKPTSSAACRHIAESALAEAVATQIQKRFEEVVDEWKVHQSALAEQLTRLEGMLGNLGLHKQEPWPPAEINGNVSVDAEPRLQGSAHEAVLASKPSLSTGLGKPTISDPASSPRSSAHERKHTESMAIHDARAHWRKMVKFHRKGAVTKYLEDKVNTRAKTDKYRDGIIRRWVRSKRLELFMIPIICAQAACVGWQVQYYAKNHEVLALHTITEITFCILFTIEVILRGLVLQYEFFLRDVAWNLFDVFCVVLMNIDLIVEHAWDGDVPVVAHPSLRILRVVRVVRVLRVIRVLIFFRELRLMVCSILGSVKLLVWAVIVISLMFYTFAITFTQGAADFCHHYSSKCDTPDDIVTELLDNFGTLERSSLSLFYSMSGGISWGLLIQSMKPLHWSFTALFISFICCAFFAVVNIVTGVFVECAMQNSQLDRETIIQEELQRKQIYIRCMQEMFEALDADGNGEIGLVEFQAAILDERMVANFNALGLEITEVETLFSLLDRDSSCSIDMEEFLVGCMRLKGEAKSLDLAKVCLESEWLVYSMGKVIHVLNEVQRELGINYALTVSRPPPSPRARA